MTPAVRTGLDELEVAPARPGLSGRGLEDIAGVCLGEDAGDLRTSVGGTAS